MKDNAEPPGGFAQLVGYRLDEWELDYAEVDLDLERRHLNRTGVLHGGVIATLIDTPVVSSDAIAPCPAACAAPSR